MSSLLLHLYPTYQSAKCVLNGNSESNANRWLVYWMTAYFIEQLPLPSMIAYPALALLYIPETTTFVRDKVISKGMALVGTYGPDVTNRVYTFFGSYLKGPENVPAAWWHFWKSNGVPGTQFHNGTQTHDHSE